MDDKIFYSKADSDLQGRWYKWFCGRMDAEDPKGWRDKVEATWEAFAEDKITLQAAYKRIDIARAALEQSRVGDQDLAGLPAPPGMGFCNNCWYGVSLKYVFPHGHNEGCPRCGCRIFLNTHTSLRHGSNPHSICRDPEHPCKRHRWKEEPEDSIAKDGDSRWMVESTSSASCHFSTEGRARTFMKTISMGKNKCTIYPVKIHII